jgi:hypothetical protein
VDVPVAVVVIVGLALVSLIAIIVAPSRRVRSERPLPGDVQARVLLGESPRQIESELEAEHEHEPDGAERDSAPSVPPQAS